MAQEAIFNQLTIPVLLGLALGKIFTTSFSIGSGGSGGVFGPSVVIGGAMGGAVGQFFHILLPAVVTQPGAFVIVGMAGFFTAVSNTPISTIIFVSEMTNSYHLLLPSLLVCSVCYLLATKWSIYENQVKSWVDSPLHAGEFMIDILQTIKVEKLKYLIKNVRCLNQDMPFSQFKQVLNLQRKTLMRCLWWMRKIRVNLSACFTAVTSLPTITFMWPGSGNPKHWVVVNSLPDVETAPVPEQSPRHGGVHMNKESG